MKYDAAAFLNSSLAVLVGIAVALVLFSTSSPRPRPTLIVAFADRSWSI